MCAEVGRGVCCDRQVRFQEVSLTNPDDYAGLGDYLTMVPVPRPPTGPRL